MSPKAPRRKKCAKCKRWYEYDSRHAGSYERWKKGSRFCSLKCHLATNAKRFKEKPMLGKAHPNWKGRRVNKLGYAEVTIPGKGRVYEHRLVMEKKLGRKLKRREIVHHKNGNKLDNHPRNLEIMTQGEHVTHHKPATGHVCKNKRDNGRFVKTL